MKSKVLKISSFILIILITLCLLVPGVFAVTFSGSGYQPRHAYSMTDNNGVGSYYCMNHTKGLSFRVGIPTSNGGYVTTHKSVDLNYDNGSMITDSTNTTKTTGVIEPSVGYAYYVLNKKGISTSGNSDLQTIIWASTQWGNTSNMVVDGRDKSGNATTTKNATGGIQARSYQFGTTYYGLLKDITEENFKKLFKCDSSNVKVLLDQTSKKYIVGPYTLGMTDYSSLGITKNNYTDAAIAYLDNELQGTNVSYDEDSAFAKFSGVTGVNGLTNKNIQFLDKNGSKIKFPSLNSKFYVECDVSDINNFKFNEDLNLEVSVLKDFTGTSYKYTGVGSTLEKVQLTGDQILSAKDQIVSKGKIMAEEHFMSGTKLTETSSIVDGSTTYEYDGGYVSGDDSTGLWSRSQTAISNMHTTVDHEFRVRVPAKFLTSGGGIDVEDETSDEPYVELTLKTSNYGLNAYAASENNTKTVTDKEAYTYNKPSKAKYFSGSAYKYDGGTKRYVNIMGNTYYTSVSFDTHINKWKYTTSNSKYTKYTSNTLTYYTMTQAIHPAETHTEYRYVWRFTAPDDSKERLEAYFPDKASDITINNAELQLNGTDVGANTQQLLIVSNVKPSSMSTTIRIQGQDTNLELGGNVFVDTKDVKTAEINGKYDSKLDSKFAGIQVNLVEIQTDGTDKTVATTLTDKNGQYRFYGKVNEKYLLNPFKKYYVNFVYNGQIYQSTYYKDNIAATGGYSNAKDVNRDSFNKKFGTISSDTDNFKVNDTWYKAFSLSEKIKDNDGNYIKNSNGEALTYEDVWNKFKDLAANMMNDAGTVGEPKSDDYSKTWNRSKSYEDVYTELINWLTTYKVDGKQVTIGKEVDQIVAFIKQSMITATTKQGTNTTYPRYAKYVAENIDNNSTAYKNNTQSSYTLGTNKYTYLYTKHSDQARYVDYGLTLRVTNDLALQKDVYKATIIVNGKQEEYMYNKKDSGIDSDGNWTIKVRASDELYNGKTTYNRELRKSEYFYTDSNTNKNLRVLVTYRIAVKNIGQVNATVNEIVDHYDADAYTFDGTKGTNGVYTPKVYNSYDNNGNVTSSKVNSYIGDRAGTKTGDIVVSEKASRTSDENKKLTGYNNLYITGLQNTVLQPGQLEFAYVTFEVNKDTTTGKVKLDEATNGKKNIAEINKYSTYYVDKTKIPDHLDDKGNKVDDVVVGNKTRTAGLIDINSNPGSLTNKDIDGNGRIITSTDSMKDRQENDTDQATNIKIIIDPTDKDVRTIKGFVYEDTRNVNSNSAVVGNGKYDNNETKIDGVTVQLVELVQNVDENGISMNTYEGERVWTPGSDYYSGIGTSKVILYSDAYTVEPDTNLGKGEYEFKSMVAGDYYVRFIYGDTTRTVLTSDANNEVNSLLGKSGNNEKSYNGQDYKSTTYQVGADQSSSYKGINGYTSYGEQNAYKVTYENGKGNVDKSKLYFYNNQNAEGLTGISDAKDVYEYRESGNKYAKVNTSLLNRRAETLDSFEKLSSDKSKATQETMLNDLMTNTAMVAQTGVINTEVEKDKTVFNYSDTRTYVIDDVDLGLEERPIAQVKLNKEVSNLKITLANNEVLFDATKSQKNLYFAPHKGHEVKYGGVKNLRLESVQVSSNTTDKPELIQTYMDDELMEGATLQVSYVVKAENVGEVDYLEKEFYYTGNNGKTVATTSVNKVVDYVSNAIKYDASKQEGNAAWDIKTVDELTGNADAENDYVNNYYADTIKTYDTVLTTNKLGGALTPNKYGSGEHAKETSLVLSTIISSSNTGDNLVYNNLAEVIDTTNTAGRRMKFSIAGNQQMADQSIKNNGAKDSLSSEELVTPAEIDADSAQKIVLMPPTGANYNYLPIIAALIAAAGMIITGVVLIRKSLKK